MEQLLQLGSGQWIICRIPNAVISAPCLLALAVPRVPVATSTAVPVISLIINQVSKVSAIAPQKLQ